MHKVTGRYDTKNFNLVIALDKQNKLHKELYDDIKNYYIYNMFIGFRRQSARLQRILLTSIGDHLNESEEQNITKADLYIDIEVVEKVSQNMLDILEKAPNWLVTVRLINTKDKNVLEEELNILIRKSDGYILRSDDY